RRIATQKYSRSLAGRPFRSRLLRSLQADNRQHPSAKWLDPTVADQGRQRSGAATIHPNTAISPRYSRPIPETVDCCARDGPKLDFAARGLAHLRQLLALPVRPKPGGAGSGRGWKEKTTRRRSPAP